MLSTSVIRGILKLSRGFSLDFTKSLSRVCSEEVVWLLGKYLFTMVAKNSLKLFAMSRGSVKFLSPSIILVGGCFFSFGAI